VLGDSGDTVSISDFIKVSGITGTEWDRQKEHPQSNHPSHRRWHRLRWRLRIYYDAGDHSGYVVSSAGDVNGDGLDDLIVGAYGAKSGAGKSYIQQQWLIN
jgi:hypothetical protein